jgi:hypothetical protein
MLRKSLAKLPIGFESLLEDNIICIENRSTRENFLILISVVIVATTQPHI